MILLLKCMKCKEVIDWRKVINSNKDHPKRERLKFDVSNIGR